MLLGGVKRGKNHYETKTIIAVKERSSKMVEWIIGNYLKDLVSMENLKKMKSSVIVFLLWALLIVYIYTYIFIIVGATSLQSHISL